MDLQNIWLANLDDMEQLFIKALLNEYGDDFYHLKVLKSLKETLAATQTALSPDILILKDIFPEGNCLPILQNLPQHWNMELYILSDNESEAQLQEAKNHPLVRGFIPKNFLMTHLKEKFDNTFNVAQKSM